MSVELIQEVDKVNLYRRGVIIDSDMAGADNTAIIERAVSNYRTVHMEGNFFTSQGINLSNDPELICAHDTTLSPLANNINVLSIHGSQLDQTHAGGLIEGLRILGDDYQGITGLLLDQAHDMTFRRCMFGHCDQWGMASTLDFVGWNTFDNCVFVRNGSGRSTGNVNIGYSNLMEFRNCISRWAHGVGYNFRKGAISVLGGSVEGNDYDGIVTEPASRCNIDRVWFELNNIAKDPEAYDIWMQGGYSTVSRCVASGDQVNNILYINGGEYNKIIGNDFRKQIGEAYKIDGANTYAWGIPPGENLIAASPRNLVPNSSFDAGVTGWGGTGCTLTASTTRKHGAKAMKITKSSPYGRACFSPADFAQYEGRICSVGAWVLVPKSNAGSPKFGFGKGISGGSGGNYQGIEKSDSWQWISRSILIPVGYGGWCIVFAPDYENTSKQNVMYVDSVVLSPGGLQNAAGYYS
jgi:hypothetical protein